MSRNHSKLADYVRDARHGGAMLGPCVTGRASLDGRPPFTIVYLDIVDGVVARMMFQTFACVVSIAACEALAELAEGQTVARCGELSEEQVFALLGEVPFGRRFCIGLAVDALRAALESYHLKVSESPTRSATDEQTSVEE